MDAYAVVATLARAARVKRERGFQRLAKKIPPGVSAMWNNWRVVVAAQRRADTSGIARSGEMISDSQENNII